MSTASLSWKKRATIGMAVVVLAIVGIALRETYLLVKPMVLDALYRPEIELSDSDESGPVDREPATGLAIESGGRLIPQIAGDTPDKQGRVREPGWRMEDGHVDGVLALAFSPDGKWLASGSADMTIRIWDVATGRELQCIEGHDKTVTGVAFSPTGKQLISTSRDSTARVWDLTTNEQVALFDRHSREVNAAAFLPDGKRVLVAGHYDPLRLWDVESERLLKTYPQSGGQHTLVVSKDGATVIVGTCEGTLRAWDVESGRPLWNTDSVQPGRGHGVSGTMLSADGSQVYYCVTDGEVQVREVRTGGLLRKLAVQHNNQVAVCPDGRLVALGGPEIRLCSVPTGTPLVRLSRGRELVHAVAFSPDGRLLAGGGGGTQWGEKWEPSRAPMLWLWDVRRVTAAAVKDGLLQRSEQ